jgi:hypothetical protein
VIRRQSQLGNYTKDRLYFDLGTGHWFRAEHIVPRVASITVVITACCVYPAQVGIQCDVPAQSRTPGDSALLQRQRRVVLLDDRTDLLSLPDGEESERDECERAEHPGQTEGRR